MTNEVVVLVEERSARIVIEALAAKVAPDAQFHVLQHVGKSDLERSISRKLSAWQSARPLRFIVSRDGAADQRDIIKRRLASFVPKAKRGVTKIRVIVHELESWYLGDPAALLDAGLLTTGKADQLRKAKFRDLCRLANPVQEFERLTGRSAKLASARALAPFLTPERNTVPSFHAFIGALRWAAHP